MINQTETRQVFANLEVTTDFIKFCDCLKINFRNVSFGLLLSVRWLWVVTPNNGSSIFKRRHDDYFTY